MQNIVIFWLTLVSEEKPIHTENGKLLYQQHVERISTGRIGFYFYGPSADADL